LRGLFSGEAPESIAGSGASLRFVGGLFFEGSDIKLDNGGQQFHFDQDNTIAESSLRKHGIDFVEAESVFDDPLSAVFPDPDHTIVEYRYVIKGHSEIGRLLLVCFTWRGDVIRIISARRLTKRETKEYEEGRRKRHGQHA